MEVFFRVSLAAVFKVVARQPFNYAAFCSVCCSRSGFSSTVPTGSQLRVCPDHRLPERTIQTGIGDVEIKVPKVRDRSSSGICFNSSLLPPYLKRSSSIEELLPWLYLRGISSGDYQEALGALLGEQAKGFVGQHHQPPEQHWGDEHREWSLRDLSLKRYVYFWADGIYINVRMGERLCLLVSIGVTEHDHKELVTVEDGLREAESIWTEVLMGLRVRGLSDGLKLAVGDGALGFWQALGKCYPDTVHQRCWMHKTANVLAALSEPEPAGKPRY